MHHIRWFAFPLPLSMSVAVIEERCEHDTVVFDMCADCGLDLRR